MKYRLLFLLFHVCIVLSADSAHGADVVVVVGGVTPVHQRIVSGINSVIKEKTVVADIGYIHTQLKSNPGLFIAIGPDALAAVKDLGAPVIFSMVMNPHLLGLEGKEITGIEAVVSVGSQLDQLRVVLPKARRIGIVYAPTSTGHIVELAKEEARKRGLAIVSHPAHSADEAIAAWDGMTGVEVFWMLPDTSVITQETVKHLLLLSLERKIPVYALSEKYVKNGALFALGLNPEMLGLQIGEMANRVLSGVKASTMPFEPVKGGDLYINTTIAEYMNLGISPDVLRRAHLNKAGE